MIDNIILMRDSSWGEWRWALCKKMHLWLDLKQGEEMKLWKRGLDALWKWAFEYDEIEVKYTSMGEEGFLPRVWAT